MTTTKTVKSIDDLILREKWSDRRILLKPSGDERRPLLWRSQQGRQPIVVLDQHDVEIDGGEYGLTIYGTGLLVRRCKNVTLRNLTIRLGARGFDLELRKQLKDEYKSYEVEALKLTDCENVLVENCAFSWGMDETVSIEDSKGIELRECIVSYPLNNPVTAGGVPIYEEKDKDHAYPCSTRGSKRVTYKRCVFAHSVARSPSFSTKGNYPVEGELRHSIVYDFNDEGTKFNASDEGRSGDFSLSIHDNYYTPHSSEAIPIAIENPLGGSTLKVKFWRNVQGTPEDIRRGDGTPVHPEAVKDGDGDLDFENKGEGNPRTSFSDILSIAGPQGAVTPYTRKVKDDILAGLLPGPLEGREPSSFRG